MNIKMLFWSVFLLLYAFFSNGCTSINLPESISSNSDTMSILMHQTCYNTKYKIHLRFDSILNDSRCPPEAVCFWAGNVQVKLQLTTEAKVNYSLMLNSNLHPFDSTIMGINYKLIDVSPGSIVNGKYDYKTSKARIVAKYIKP